MVSGAEALKRALETAGKPPKKSPTRSREDAIVDHAFKLLETPIKGWIRARVRQGSSALESVAALSQMLSAGQSVLDAAGTVFRAVQTVRKAVK